MTTGLNVGAAASGIKSLTRDLEQLRAAVRGVNGDLSKLPSNIRAEVEAAQNIFDGFAGTPMGRGLRQRDKATNFRSDGRGMHYIWDPDRLSTKPGGGAQIIDRTARVLGVPTGGGAATGGAGGAGGGGSEGGGGGGAPPEEPAGGGKGPGIGAGMAAMGRFLLPLLGITTVAGTLVSAFKSAQQYMPQVDGLLRRMDDLGGNFGDLDSKLKKFGDGLQMSAEDSVRFASIFAREANIRDTDAVVNGGRAAAGFARAYGLDPNSTGGALGSMAYHQIGGGNMREIVAMVAQTVASSGMNARADEALDTIARFADQAASGLTKDPTGATAQFGALYGSLTSGNAGMGGAAAAGILNRADSSFRQGGGMGDASKVFLWRALGEHDPYQYRYDLEGGLFEGNNFKKTMGSLDQYTSGMGKMQGLDARANVLGLNMRQAEVMQNTWQQLKDGKIRDTGDFQKFLAGAGVDLNNANPSSIQNLADIYQGKDLGSIRDRLMAGASSSERDRMKNASPDQLQAILAQVAANQGRPENEGTLALDAMTQIKNALINGGEPIAAIVNRIANVVAPSMNQLLSSTDTPYEKMEGAGGGRFGNFHVHPHAWQGTPLMMQSAQGTDLRAIVDAIREGFVGSIRPHAGPGSAQPSPAGATGVAYPYIMRPQP